MNHLQPFGELASDLLSPAVPDATVHTGVSGFGELFGALLAPSDEEPSPGNTRELTVRIDRDAWKRLQLPNVETSLKIPAELDIPDGPVPVGSDVARKLQTFEGSSSPAPVDLVHEEPSICRDPNIESAAGSTAENVAAVNTSSALESTHVCLPQGSPNIIVSRRGCQPSARVITISDSLLKDPVHLRKLALDKAVGL